jgi:acyl-CoA reductase-like NAD-dependent aldehyde dehydrogenase
MGYASTNPYTNKVVKTVSDGRDTELDAALDKAHAAFRSWRTTPIGQPVPTQGAFVPPTILTGGTADNPANDTQFVPSSRF